MNSLNLVEIVRGELPDEFGTKLSSLLGEKKDKTQMAIDAAIPAVLAGIANTASTSDGAARVASAVDHADDGILSIIGSMVGKSTESATGSLRSILGGGLSELAANIGSTSGLSRKAVTILLGVLTPVVLSILKNVKRSRGLDDTGLAGLLSSQREHIAAAMPVGMRMAESYSRVREPARKVRHERYRTARLASHPEETKTVATERRIPLGTILPLALLALSLGLLWYWGTRPVVRAVYEDTTVAIDSAEPPSGRTASFEALKTKYDSAIEEAREQGVRISISEQGGKLDIRGFAPSAEAAHRVIAEIRRVNPNMDDVVIDLGVDSSRAVTPPQPSEDTFSRAKPAAPVTGFSPESGAETYTVKRGDTLGKISKRFYGNEGDYMRIFDQNRNRLRNVHDLSVGQRLEIPAK